MAAACSDQRANPGGSAPAIREGARISAQGTARFHVLAAGSDTVVEWNSSAVVRRGVATGARRQAPTSLSEAAGGLLPQFAVADRIGATAPTALGPRTFTYTDTTKHHFYRLVATPGPAAGAPARLESFVDGEKVMQSDFAWTREVGGWRAQSAHVTGYYRGAALVEFDVTATSAEVAAAAWNLSKPLAVLAAGILPTELQAMQMCEAQWVAYTLAWGAYSIATIQLYLEPWSLIARLEYGLAAATYAASEVALYACYANGTVNP